MNSKARRKRTTQDDDDLTSPHVHTMPMLPRRTGTSDTEREARCRRCATRHGWNMLKHASDDTYQLWNGNGTMHTGLVLEDVEELLLGRVID